MKKITSLVTLFILGACQSVMLTDEPVPPQPAPTEVQLPVDEVSPIPDPETAPQVVSIAVQDLASRLDLNPEHINLIGWNPITWPDSSLGCPQEGMMYAQAETEGFIIWLEAKDNLYRYHTDAIENVVLCETPQLPGFPVTPGEIDDGQPWVPVE